MKFTINLNDANKLKYFIDTVNKYPCDIDLLKGRYIIDAKSIMGIFTLDLVENITLEIHCDNEEVLNKFKEDIKEVIVDA